MLRFSIRELLLLTLAVACLIGWWRNHVSASAERTRLAGQVGRLQLGLRQSTAVIQLLQARCDVLAEEKSRLEGENLQMERRMLDHSSRIELDLTRFQKLQRKSRQPALQRTRSFVGHFQGEGGKKQTIPGAALRLPRAVVRSALWACDEGEHVARPSIDATTARL
jgi:hypothetical protein